MRALFLTLPSQDEFKVAAASTAGGISVREYKKRMGKNEYGDNLVIAQFAKHFGRAISVIGPHTTRTFLPSGGEHSGVLEDAAWVAFRPEVHYYGVLRNFMMLPQGSAASGSASSRGTQARASSSSRGTALAVRDRQDGACGGIGKRRALRLWDGAFPKGKRRQTGGTEGRYDDGEGEIADVGDDLGAPPSSASPYISERQYSPGRHRGRRRLRGRVPKIHRGK